MSMNQKRYEDEDIKNLKNWFSQRNVCFASNTSNWSARSLFRKSYGLYEPLIDKEHFNFVAVNGSNQIYGYEAFISLIDELLYKKSTIKRKCDYLVYMDEDCFIADLFAMKAAVEDFILKDRAFAGCPDGGVLCHRNHNGYCINTFFTIFNIKQLREMFPKTREEFRRVVNEEISKCTWKSFKEQVSDEMWRTIENEKKVNEFFVKTRRDSVEEPKYCEIVRNDISNPIEPNQIPYSSKEDDFEPYYRLFLWIMLHGGKPYYFVGSDIWKDKEGKEVDNLGGICSGLYFNEVDEWPFCYHTWFARAYDPNGTINHPIVKRHTRRINQIFDYVNNLSF